MPPSEFADSLRRLRLTAGLSQEELAVRAGLSGDAVAALERGRRRVPRPMTVRLLADALKLSDEQRAAFIRSSRQEAHTASRRLHRAPVAADEFVGRSSDLAEVIRLLTQADARLVTLTGPGGVGKTRLAIEVAAALRQTTEAGISWASLGSSTDASSVTAAVAEAVGLTESSDRGRLDLLIEHLADEHSVVFLDNCEHVIDIAAGLCAALLAGCPHVKIVATSRELLRVAGETIKPVQPLAPDDAVEMFTIRAAAHGLRAGDEDRTHVRRICRRLDGIPLAIELAAARVNVLTIEQIAHELAASFQILNAGVRTAPARQQTLRAAIGWSHDLLEPDEQRFFAIMSVFSGGWTVAAAQALCRDDQDASGHAEIIDMTGRLADKSLIVVRREGTTARYDMFDVIREFAAERLDEAGRRDETERRHLRYFIALAERAEPELRGPDHKRWLARLDIEIDNFRVAVRRALRRGPASDALRLTGALATYCYLRGHYSEGRTWLTSALEAHSRADAPAEDARLHAKALLGAGYLAFLQCEYREATETLGSALTLHRDLDDHRGAALTLRYLGSIAREQGRYDEANRLHHSSLEIYTELGDDTGVAWARHHLGFAGWLRENWAAAREHAAAALQQFQRIGDGEGVVWSLISLGSVALYTGQLDEATRLMHQALVRAQAQGFREGVAWSQNQLGMIALRQADFDRAAKLLDESLAVHQALGDRWRSASVLEALSLVMVRRGQAKQAAFMLGVAAAVRSDIDAPVPRCEESVVSEVTEEARANLGARQFGEAWAEGNATALHQI